MEKLRKIDLWIVIPYILLLGIGVVMVYSASFYNAMMNGGSSSQYLIKQGIFAVMGLILCLLFFMLKEKLFKKQGFVVIFLGGLTILPLGLLIVKGVINPASRINGASAWINLKFFNYQPLEMAKLSLVLYLALFLTNKQAKLMAKQTGKTVWKEIQQPVITIMFMIGLVLFEPDMGGAAILGFITLILISASTIPFKYIWRFNGGLVGLFTLAIVSIVKFQPSFIVKNYQYARVLAMQHPFQLERTSGAQLVNSFYAISNGGIFGVGLGNSIQKRGYLPEPHTDFILAIISEELGLVGDIVVLGLIFLIVSRMILLGIRSKSNYNSLVYYGIATMLLSQTILNVGGLLGLVPLTGVTLPFISYGGSSMLVLSMGLGIVLNLEATAKFSKEK
ncbi:FtsW/RodA/SpoVE family cell cycle protein [Companilactobacillus allii]|uniref:Probable peptidoglycan glycosyltransferase FtsW n=1 Tax=Companilactobacillus allii TaxID=1847728 RepID=A0A1P8Q581_9LACO|nr:FtsW/RodA/SpoVE family cell cycle protein [Companilactobacillus allii]APX73022.1 cell division protein FtsW [Companilactobacillus allii]USQ67818.1 FtsW/RodA/SpoVE family cell cycle protein [Companilactobacillus allii]